MRSILILCLICSAALAHAQSKLDTGSFSHWNLKNGFPSNNVYSAIQDANGYIWFATDNGVVKYNGYSLEVYNTENGGLPVNDVFELYEDARGRIWLKSFGYEFGYLKNGRYKRINYKGTNRRVAPYHLMDLGDIFMFIEGQGGKSTFVFVSDNILFQASVPDKIVLPGDSSGIFVISVTPPFNLTIWSEKGNIYRLNTKTRKFRKIGTYPSELIPILSNRTTVSPIRDEIIANVVNGEELHRFDLSSQEHKKVDINDFGATPTEKTYTVNTAWPKRNMVNTHAAITSSHLYTFSTSLDFISRQKINEVIPSNTQLAYRLKDRDSNMWYTTNSDGAWFRPQVHDFYAGLKKNPALSRARYLGTAKNKTYWWNKNTLTLYMLDGNNIIGSTILKQGIDLESITANSRATYITASDGVYIFDENKKTLVNVTSRYHIRNTYVSKFLMDRLQRTDVGLGFLRSAVAIDDSIFGLTAEAMRVLRFSEDTITVSNISPDRYLGICYAGTTHKVYAYSNLRVLILELIHGKERIFKEDQLAEQDIRNIRQLEVDRHGNVFLLADNHLFIFNETTGNVKTISSAFSFSSSTLRLYKDQLIIAGKFGLASANVYKKDSVGSFSVLPNTGMDRYNRVQNFVIDSNGIAILQTDIGWSSFSIDSFNKYASSPARSKDFFSLIVATPVEKVIKVNDTIKINQAENILKLDAINWYAKGEPKYSYRIDNETKWEKSTSGEIFLATLTPGVFHKVNCKIDDDCWQSEIYTFYVYRYPHWWQTTNWKTIFWITGVLLLAGLVLLSILITRNYVARKGEKKRALTELELRAIHSQINPHFIFNTLNSSLFFINKKRFDDAYDHVNKFSRLLRAYLKSSQDRFVILEEEITMLRNYIELQQTRFEEKFDYSIEVDNKLPINNIRIPSLLLQPLVENAINHGLFHKERGEKGELILKFQQGASSTELICIIEDNGVGRAAAKKINEETTSKESYGTKLTHQLLEIFKEYEALDISLEYTDKQAPQTGTIVTLTLKNIKYIV